MLDAWQPDGDGYKGPCPLCSGGAGRRAWVRPVRGRWRAACSTCGARGRALLRAVFNGAPPAADQAEPVPLDRDAVALGGEVWRAARPLDSASSNGPGAAWGYLHGRCSGRWRGPFPADAVRWLPLLRWPDGLNAWLRPWRRVEAVTLGTDLSGMLGSRVLWRAPDGAVYARSTARVDTDVDGCIVWRWTGLGGRPDAFELEALAGGRRREIRRAGGAGAKRPALVGSRFGGRLFVAGRRRSASAAVHVFEGGLDALAGIAAGLVGDGAALGVHGAGRFVDAAARHLPVDVPIHLWSHGDEDGERGVAHAARILDGRGAGVVVHFGPGDVASGERFDPAILPAAEIPTWDGRDE